jgi:tRNA A-37 threonylcarbamoyl transferase component Bud32
VKAPNNHTLAWTIKEEYQDILSPHLLERLLNRVDITDCETVRTLPSRTVQYLKPTSPALPPLFLKEYHPPTVLARIKHLFRSPAEKEWRAAQALTRKMVPTFVPLAVGKPRRRGLTYRSCLISKSIDGGESLKDYLSQYHPNQSYPTGVAKRRTLIALAHFVRDLHQKGVVHQDFHWGNILVTPVEGKPVHFYLMDLHRIQVKVRLTDKERIHNLASLNTAFVFTWSKTERWRFLKAYVAGDTRWEQQSRHFARRIEAVTVKMVQKQWLKRDKRYVQENKYVVPFMSGSYRGCINRRFSSPELLALLHDPDHAFSAPGSITIKDSNTTSSCTLPVTLGGGNVALHIKRYNYQNSLYALKNYFRCSRGKRVWKTAQGLLTRNIATPLPISFAEQRKGRLLLTSYFITRKIDRALPLSTVLQKGMAVTFPHNYSRKNMLLFKVAHLVREMHARGIWHRDLKASNILVQKKVPDEEKLYLVDLDSVRIKRRLGRKEKIRDLARLNTSLVSTTTVSMTDRLRFLQYYLKTRRPRDRHIKDYWKAIAAQTQKKMNPSGLSFPQR